MTHSLPQNQTVQLQECLDLAQDVTTHAEANQTFLNLLGTLEATPHAAEIAQTLWNELLSAHRSARFWQQMSDVEKQMSDRLAETHVQLQQNYLRLIQEQ